MPRCSMLCTLVSSRSIGTRLTIAVIRVMKSPAVNRPCAASKPAATSITATPAAPVLTGVDRVPRVTSIFSASRRFCRVCSP